MDVNINNYIICDMENVAVSVIMPVYNSEQYVRSAIDSVLSQDFESFELILVDDGSTDSSGAICDEFAEKDSRVHVIHQQNAGTSAARNAGLKIAQGEYITFCDHDDEYLPHLLRDNYEVAKKNNADVICFDIVRNFSNVGEFFELSYKTDTFIIGEGDVSRYYAKLRCLDIPGYAYFSYVWNKLYKKNVIKDVFFDSIYKHGQEDLVFNIEILRNVKDKYVVQSKTYYRHNLRNTSSSRTFVKGNDEILYQEYSRCINVEYYFLCDFFTKENRSFNELKNILIQHLYFLFSRIQPDNKKGYGRYCQLPLFNQKYDVDYKTKLLLFSFKNCPILFSFLCKKQWGLTVFPVKQRCLNKDESNYFETALNGFFLNLYQSKRGRWLFDLCNFGVKVITLPFRLFK